MTSRNRLSQIKTRVWRHLMPLATAVLVVMAAVFAILALRPPPSGTPTLVAKADVDAGEVISGRNATIVLLPEIARPSDTLSDYPSAELPTTGPIGRGEVIVEADFSSSSVGIPNGMSRLMVEVSDKTVSVKAGDLVQVWGPTDACVLPESPIEQLATEAVVEKVTEGTTGTLQGESPTTIELLVASSQVPGVLCASVQGTVHFVVSGQ